MPKLVVESGSQQGAVYNFRARLVVVAGRGEGVHIQIQDPQASRKHFAVEKHKGRYLLRDLNSTNGTFLNGRPVKSAWLKEGDRIRVGQVVMVFRGDDEEDPLIGQRVGGYLIHEKVGSGGMGTVYMASQLSMDRVVALKILSERFVKNPDFVSRFISEARAAGKLNHPNVVQVHDVGKVDNVYYYSMEFMKGGSLQDLLLRRKRLPWEEALRIALDAARGLEYARTVGLVHRDIKPDNLMLTETGMTKICDLGIAEFAGKDSGEEEEGRRMVVGSPHYMAPEQALGKPVDHRADIYALGATLYRMLSGRTPYSGRTAEEILKKKIATDPPPLTEFGVPRQVAAVVEKMMQRDPEKRYRTAGEVVAVLERLLSGKGGVGNVGSRPARHVSRRSYARRRSSSSSMVFVMGILLLLAAVFVLLMVLSGGRVSVSEAPVRAVSAVARGGGESAGGAVGRAGAKVTVADEMKAQKMLVEAGRFEEEHPGEWDAIRKKYEAVITKFPGTPSAKDARERIERLKVRESAARVAAANSYRAAASRAADLVKEDRFGEAVKAFSAVVEKYPGTEHAEKAAGRIERIRERAEERYKDVVERAAGMEKNGRWDEAIALYGRVIDRFGIDGIVEDARNRKKSLEEKKEAYLARSRARLERAHKLLSRLAFEDGLKELREFADEHGADGSLRKAIREAEALNEAKQVLIAAVNGGRFADMQVAFAGDIVGSPVQATEDSITVEVSAGTTVKGWDALGMEGFCNLVASCPEVKEDARLVLARRVMDKDPALAVRLLSSVTSEEGKKVLAEAKARLDKDARKRIAEEYKALLQKADSLSPEQMAAVLAAFVEKYPDFKPDEGIAPVEWLQKLREEVKRREEAGRLRVRMKGVIARNRSTLFSHAAAMGRFFRVNLLPLRRGEIYARLQMYSQSISAFRAAFAQTRKNAPEDALDAVCGIMKVLTMCGKKDQVPFWEGQAKALLARVPEEKGKLEDARQWMEEYAEKVKKLKEAEEEWESSPADPEKAFALAMCYADAERVIDAVSVLQGIEEIFPDCDRVKSGDVAWRIGTLLRDVVLLDDAAVYFQRIMKHFPDLNAVKDGKALAFLADCYWEKGDGSRAYALYRRLLKKYPNAPAWIRRRAVRRIAIFEGREP